MGKSGFGKIRPFLLAAMALILVGFWILAAFGRPRGDADAAKVDVAGNLRSTAERHIKDSDKSLREFVQYAHRTVTVKRLEPVRIQPVTTDGGDLKPDLSNLKYVEIEVRAVWDGWLHKSGETVVAYRLAHRGNGQLTPSAFKVLRTTAWRTRSECQ